MSKVLSRHWLGFEISEEYVTLAKKRVEYAPTPLPLFVENGQPKAEQTSMF
jgi:DNA modification methylase